MEWEAHTWSGGESEADLARADEEKRGGVGSWEEGGGAASAGEAELAVRYASPTTTACQQTDHHALGPRFNHPYPPPEPRPLRISGSAPPCGTVLRTNLGDYFAIAGFMEMGLNH